MADRNLALQFIISAKDTASGVLAKIVSAVKFLDSEISVIAGKIREKFSDLFGGGLDGAKEFEAQLDKVQAKGDYTAESMAQLKQAAVEVGAKFGLTGTEAAQGMEALAAAGLNATQVMQALPPVLALAKAEGISMDAAAEKLSDSLSIMGLGFEQAGKMADVLAKGANVSTTSASALAQALSTAGGIARTAGLDLEQTVGALSALANAGIKGERAGTALAAILTQLTNPASAASKELSALGITTRDLGEVVGQLAAKGDASNAAILAFGETAGPGLRALIGQGQQSLNDLTGQLRNADGAAQQAADGIGGNLKGALKGLQSAWENVKTALFDPVLEPLTQAANDAATALNTQLIGGALKPAQAAVKEFAVNSIQAARDFIAGFDFKGALQSLQSLVSGAAESFQSIASEGKTAADVVTIAWNAVTAGFRTVGSALLAVAASAVQTLANMEEVASKIGLGSQQRANELRETANSLQAKATELINQVATDGREMQAAYARLTTSTDAAAEANQRLKDSLPAAEIQTLNKSLADYATIAERANAAAKQAQQDFFAGKITMEQLADAADAAASANDDLEQATRRATEAAKAGETAGQQAAEQHKATATELAAVAKSSQDAANQQGTYTGALEQAGAAQVKAIQTEIELARVKGDTIGAARKTIELAQAEADIAAKVAESKRKEADELGKTVAAQEAYLKAIGGGTAAQQQELEILKLKQAALQSEAASTAELAQLKADITAKTQQFIIAGYDEIEAKKLALLASGQYTAAMKIEEEQRKKVTEAAEKQKDADTGAADALRAAVAAAEQAADAAKAAADQTKAASAAANSALQGWSDRLGALSDKARQAFDGYDESAQGAADSSQELADAIAGLATGGYVEWANRVAIRALEIEQRFNGQAESAQRLTEQLQAMADGGRVNMNALALATRGVSGEFDLLDQQRLDNLQSAIDAANAKLRQMQAEAEDARAEIARLNAEIAAEQGDTEKAALLKQQLDYQQALADIEAKRAQAELEGNRKLVALYDEQARKLTELNALKEKNIKADAESARQQSSSNTTSAAALPGGAGAAALPSSSGTSVRTYNLNLTGVKGRTLPATTTTDPASFLDELERARSAA